MFMFKQRDNNDKAKVFWDKRVRKHGVKQQAQMNR